MHIEQEIDVLKRQVHALRQQVHTLDEWVDTVSSPLYKRLWWSLCGFRFRRVGRWWPSKRYPDLH
jgi:hypothetical protein